MPASTQVQKLIDDFRRRRPIRATALVMTIYGDSVEPHGGSIWLGSLIKLLEPLGVNQRLVRTSIFRLTRDNWLTACRQGRRSFYRLTESGRRQFEDADARIYLTPAQQWDGNWQMVILTTARLPGDQREAVRRELVWQGFGQISVDVFAHPVAPLARVQKMLAEKSLENCAVLMRARVCGEAPFNTRAITELVRTCCDLNRIEAHYNAFIARFAALADALEDGRLPDPPACFLLRTLLIDGYRRILLQDPQLPAELLPSAWSGDRARALTARIYRALSEQAEAYLQTCCETETGLFGPPGDEYYRRFGGLNAPANRPPADPLPLVEVHRHPG